MPGFCNWTDDVTPAGTLAQIGLGLLGVDLPMDARDLAYDLTHWEQTPEHLKQTLIDLAAILPVVGGLKYLDEAAALVKGGLKSTNEAVDAADDAAKGANKAISEGAGDVLPKAEKVTVDAKKVTEYALNPDNISGGANKARVFESALGYNKSNAKHLMQQIQSKLPTSKAIIGSVDEYGQRFMVDIPITGPNGKTAIVRTGWILETGSDVPRMTTIFVK